jgi:hypothetical protein
MDGATLLEKSKNEAQNPCTNRRHRRAKKKPLDARLRIERF